MIHEHGPPGAGVLDIEARPLMEPVPNPVVGEWVRQIHDTEASETGAFDSRAVALRSPAPEP